MHDSDKEKLFYAAMLKPWYGKYFEQDKGNLRESVILILVSLRILPISSIGLE